MHHAAQRRKLEVDPRHHRRHVGFDADVGGDAHDVDALRFERRHRASRLAGGGAAAADEDQNSPLLAAPANAQRSGPKPLKPPVTM